MSTSHRKDMKFMWCLATILEFNFFLHFSQHSSTKSTNWLGTKWSNQSRITLIELMVSFVYCALILGSHSFTGSRNLCQPEQFYEEGSGEGICKCLASRCSWTSVLGRNVFHLDLTLQPLFVFRGFGCSRIGVDRATESRAHEIQACDVNSSHRISG